MADCGPAEAAEKVQANGLAEFPGTNPNYAILVWHGSNGDDKVYGEMPFSCLAPDDNPQSTVTAQGNLPIDQTLPAWGSSKGGTSANPTGINPTAPCQIRVTSSLPAYSPSDIFDPINLTATGNSSSGGSGSTGAAGQGTGAGEQGDSASGQGSGAAAGTGGTGSGGSSSASVASDPGHASSSGLFGGSLAQTGIEIAGLVLLALALAFAGFLLVR